MAKGLGPAPGVKGVKIGVFNVCTIVVACVLFAVIMALTVTTAVRYRELLEDGEAYVAAEHNAAMMREASDYLTEQARMYVVHGHIEHVELFFEEVNVVRRRETVLQNLDTHNADGSLTVFLTAALDSSNALMQQEIYAMKLAAVAYGHKLEELPQEVRYVELLPEDAGLSGAEKLQKASSIVLGEEYYSAKQLIYGHISRYTRGILSTVEFNQAHSAAELAESLAAERIMLAVLAALNVAIFLGIILLVTRPLRVFLGCIKNKTDLPPTTAFEFNQLAAAYNGIYSENKSITASEAKMKYKAEHDPLTGLLNRQVFGHMDEEFSGGSGPIALLIADVDLFKNINDTFGHDVGDRVLKKVADAFAATFRANDYVFRIGGDEFACILTGVTANMAHIIEAKIAALNQRLKTSEDGLPEAGLSVGVAFSEQGFTEGLYRQADAALYRVKRSGRGGCRVYCALDAPN